ncbi:hypothetical protein NQZ68_014268 [Dissostichus eleginoides]|nr:hypothetical protein NQZ68_014268 [Dissostichus eleginoides]
MRTLLSIATSSSCFLGVPGRSEARQNVILILTKLYDFHIGSVTESTLWSVFWCHAQSDGHSVWRMLFAMLLFCRII